MATAYIDHVSTLELQEVNGVVRKLKRKVRVKGLTSTDYNVLVEALREAEVPSAGSRLVPEALAQTSPFGMLVLAEREVKLLDNNPEWCDVILDYQHFMDADNQEIGAGYAVTPGSVGGEQCFFESGFWICPVGVTEVLVQCRGAGGGSIAPDTLGSAGGGGGAFASREIPVSAGTIYPITVGTGGLGDGGDSWFLDNTTVKAVGGKAPTVPTLGGLGGAAADCVGTVRYSGGNGGSVADASGAGAGGGGCAGPLNNGGDGEGSVITVAGSGGQGADGVGNGGDGGTDVDGLGGEGMFPGGGAGGNYNDFLATNTGGSGLVVVSWKGSNLPDIGASSLISGNISLYGKSKTSVHQTKTNYYNEPVPSIKGVLTPTLPLVWTAALPWLPGEIADYKGQYWFCLIARDAGSPAPDPAPIATLGNLPAWRIAVPTVDYLIPNELVTRRRQVVVGHHYPAGHKKYSNQTVYQTGEITVMQPQRNFTVQGHIYTHIPWVIANKLIAGINLLPWMDGLPYEWMCTEVSWENIFIRQKYKFKFEFQHNPDGWLPTAIFVDPETNKPVVDVVSDFGVKEIHYHKEIDFNTFFQATFEQ